MRSIKRSRRFSKRSRFSKRINRSKRYNKKRISRRQKGGSNIEKQRNKIFRSEKDLSKFVNIINGKEIKLIDNINLEIPEVNKESLDNSLKNIRNRYKRNKNSSFLISIEEKEGKDYLRNFAFYENHIMPFLDSHKNLERDILNEMF